MRPSRRFLKMVSRAENGIELLNDLGGKPLFTPGASRAVDEDPDSEEEQTPKRKRRRRREAEDTGRAGVKEEAVGRSDRAGRAERGSQKARPEPRGAARAPRGRGGRGRGTQRAADARGEGGEGAGASDTPATASEAESDAAEGDAAAGGTLAPAAPARTEIEWVDDWEATDEARAPPAEARCGLAHAPRVGRAAAAPPLPSY